MAAFPNPRGFVVVALAILILMIFAWTAFLSSYSPKIDKLPSSIPNFPSLSSPKPPTKSSPQPSRQTSISYSEALHALYKPLILNHTAPAYKDLQDGKLYELNNTQPAWRHSLRKDLCIVDIDTRGLADEKQIFNETFVWQDLEGVSNGMLNHYMYAAIHGYDYKFVNPTTWPNDARDNVWTKVPALREILKEYRIVLMIDADAMFRHLEVPFEWLMNRWNFTEQTSIAMPWDVEFNINDEGYPWPMGYTLNAKGDLNPNAGVVIAQNLPRTFEMIEHWIGCPDRPEPEFAECKRFHHGWPAEQGAFGEFTRYEYNKETDFLGFSCDDANGFPSQRTECQGQFIRHFTTSKGELKEGVGEAVLGTVMQRTQLEMVNAGGLIIKKNSSELIDPVYWNWVEPEKEDEDNDDENKEDEGDKEDEGEAEHEDEREKEHNKALEKIEAEQQDEKKDNEKEQPSHENHDEANSHPSHDGHSSRPAPRPSFENAADIHDPKFGSSSGRKDELRDA